MPDQGRYSDEPTRVQQIIDNFLSGQSGSSLGVEGGPEAVLRLGADAKDDCAVFDVAGPASIVVGSDYVRGPKFVLYEIGLLSRFDIGYYLVAANVSDIAAMGAVPLGVLTVVRYPNELDDAGFREIMAGIHQACADFGTLNVGGDIGNAERIILSGTAVGICSYGKVLSRAGAKPGDVLCITGPCGLLGAAVAYFPKREANKWSLPPDTEAALLDSWRRPRARVAEGKILAGGELATACQDTSDGLKATIEQIATASGVGFAVNELAVPIDPCVESVAKLMNVETLALAMSASSDLQLAFTVAPDKLSTCREEFRRYGLVLYEIGHATDQSDHVRAIDAKGASRALPGVAWKHQKSDISTLVKHEGS